MAYGKNLRIKVFVCLFVCLFVFKVTDESHQGEKCQVIHNTEILNSEVTSFDNWEWISVSL